LAEEMSIEPELAEADHIVLVVDAAVPDGEVDF
jgi:hypothetical protein